MKTKKQIAILAVLGTVTLTACGNKTDPNEKNFGAALTQYFEKKGDLCLNTKRWPLDLNEFDLRQQKTTPTSPSGQMAALEAVGLVKGADIEVEIMGIMGKPTGGKTRIRRYVLTDAAKPFAQERPVDLIDYNNKSPGKHMDLCWGKKALGKIVKWEGPIKFGDYQAAGITYLYKVDNLANWATKPEVQAAFPVVKVLLDGADTKEAKHSVKLTSQGWEAAGLDR